MTKAERRQLHDALNDLSHNEVAAIVRRSFPDARGAGMVNALAKSVIANAHRQVSPRLPRMQRG